MMRGDSRAANRQQRKAVAQEYAAQMRLTREVIRVLIAILTKITKMICTTDEGD
jgi:hypothetical protein